MRLTNRTLEIRDDCVIETWYLDNEFVGVTVFAPGTLPPEDPEVECPDGYLGSIDVLLDGTFEADISAGHAAPIGVYPTFDDALAAILH